MGRTCNVFPPTPHTSFMINNISFLFMGKCILFNTSYKIAAIQYNEHTCCTYNVQITEVHIFPLTIWRAPWAIEILFPVCLEEWWWPIHRVQETESQHITYYDGDLTNTLISKKGLGSRLPSSPITNHSTAAIRYIVSMALSNTANSCAWTMVLLQSYTTSLICVRFDPIFINAHQGQNTSSYWHTSSHYLNYRFNQDLRCHRVSMS